jgi:hypothetical protein
MGTSSSIASFGLEETTSNDWSDVLNWQTQVSSISTTMNIIQNSGFILNSFRKRQFVARLVVNLSPRFFCAAAVPCVSITHNSENCCIGY